MIQQSLLEFYFATQEGSEKYKVVLGKDADAYITNFDETGSIEAWENLYAQEDKPTLVFSNRHEIINNYIYIPKPITPQTLADAAISIQHLLKNTATTQAKETPPLSDKFLQFPSDPSIFIDQDSAMPLNKIEEEAIIPIANNIINDDALSIKEEKNIDKQEDEFAFIDEISLKKEEAPNKQEFIDEISLKKEEVPNKQEFIDDLNVDQELDQLDSNEEDIFAGLELLDDISFQDNIPKEKEELSFDASFLNTEAPTLAKEEEPEPSNDNDDISSPDELQHFLDELNEKHSLEEDESQESKRAKKKNKQKIRWRQLCGEYKNDNYKKSSSLKTTFKRKDTLLPYLLDTIAFTARAKCWMELAYKPLSILINPEKNIIYSNLSVSDPIFIQICNGKTLEELIEYLEVAPEKIEQVKNNQLSNKLFSYDFTSFLWTVGLLVSHGCLPEDVNPDEKMSISNWLSLNEVEKFPYTMQIAAVFNRQYASLNETAAWLTIPKRYVYAFYNGVAALDIVEKNPDKLNDKKLMTMPDNRDNDEGMIKNLLFKKII